MKISRFNFFSIIAIILICILLAVIFFTLPGINNGIRKNRILSIYSSLNLNSEKYIITSESIFGDKRVYNWDSSRSFSSVRKYVRGANVDVTVKELKAAIANAGFVFFEEPLPGSTSVQLHYKSQKNEYIRMSVSSKLRDDAFYNELHMGVTISPETLAINPNAGPSNVTIKVNLDDNNE